MLCLKENFTQKTLNMYLVMVVLIYWLLYFCYSQEKIVVGYYSDIIAKHFQCSSMADNNA